ncbi:MAG: hypothetical protein GXP42_00500 [Chloroflexi bacterium]|nr:hypothetical protein [Chloroflexota bacterium]
MLNERKIAEVLDEYVEDMFAGRLPRIYHRMASAIGIDVDSLLELIPLLEMATLIYLAGREVSVQFLPLSSRRNGKTHDHRQN